MKKYYFLLVLNLLGISTSFSQKLISFTNEKAKIENRKFYITIIYDERENKDYVGEISNGLLSKTEKIDIEGGTLKSVGDFLKRNFSKNSNNQIPVIISLQKIEIKQEKKDNIETGSAYVSIKFEPTKGIVAIKDALVSEETNNAFSTHSKRLKKAILTCIEKYNSLIEEPQKNYEIDDNLSEINEGNNEDALEITFNNNDNWEKEEKKKTKKNNNYYEPELKDVKTVGFLISSSILGFNYERRIHKNFGIHAGAGFIGYTAGIKIHANAKPSSLFLNLSWKDTGLGYINGIGIEGGGRWIWSQKRNFGLYYQAGFFIINHMDQNYKKTQYTDKGLDVPGVVLSYGIGLSW